MSRDIADAYHDATRFDQRCAVCGARYDQEIGHLCPPPFLILRSGELLYEGSVREFGNRLLVELILELKDLNLLLRKQGSARMNDEEEEHHDPR